MLSTYNNWNKLEYILEQIDFVSDYYADKFFVSRKIGFHALKIMIPLVWMNLY